MKHAKAPQHPAELVAELVAELLDKYEDRDGRSNLPLLERVAELVEPGNDRPRDQNGGAKKPGKRPVAPSPVADGPLHLLTDVQAGARDLEATARRARGFTTWPRGDSAANTRAALEALGQLVAGLDPGSTVALDVLHSVKRWHMRARDLIGARQAWTPLRGHVCPYCGLASLRQRPRDGALVCITPTCSTAPAGEPQVRPEWTFESYSTAALVIGEAS